MHLRLFAANPARKPNAAANSVDAAGVIKNKKNKYEYQNHTFEQSPNVRNNCPMAFSLFFPCFICHLKGTTDTIANADRY